MGTKEPTPIRRESGKGADFVKRTNPFQTTFKTDSAPNFDEVPLLGAALDSVLQCGCAIILGRTRDGGANVITILDGAERYRTYCSNDEELGAAVRMMNELYGTQ
jgi:hypothetical protein